MLEYYTDFTTCATYVVEQFEDFSNSEQGVTLGDFFNHFAYVDLVDDLVAMYHYEIFNTAGNCFIAAKRVPNRIVTLAKERGVDVPKGFSIVKDEHANRMFLTSINSFREARDLTNKRMTKIRNQNRDQVTVDEEERRKRVRMIE